MKRFFERIHRGNGGFTLVELLIVFTLLGVLAAIVIPSVSGIVGYGQTQAADAELSIVQSAMDAMMAQESQATVTPTAATSDMSSFPTDNVLYPDYLRVATTKGTYSCNTSGLVTRETTGYE